MIDKVIHESLADRSSHFFGESSANSQK